MLCPVILRKEGVVRGLYVQSNMSASSTALRHIKRNAARGIDCGVKTMLLAAFKIDAAKSACIEVRRPTGLPRRF